MGEHRDEGTQGRGNIGTGEHRDEGSLTCSHLIDVSLILSKHWMLFGVFSENNVQATGRT